MYRGLRVAVVIPAFQEAGAIARAIAGVPEWVDRVIVVDDASRDDTAARALAAPRPLELIRHRENRGVGAAIVSGYVRVLAGEGADVAVVMAGDAQMDPRDLPALLDPIAEGRADYAKGDRFRDPEVWREMPPSRVVGNIALSLATRVTSGYSVFDSQCGYTAASRPALEAIDLERVFPRYGYPNDLLAKLHAARMRVVDVPVRPVYGPEWKSGINPAAAVVPIARVLLRSWIERRRAERPASRRIPARAARLDPGPAR